MIYVLLTDGFEELEAVAPVDFLRRAGGDVVTVGVGGKAVTGAHGILMECDISEEDAALDERLEMLVLPGGPGVSRLDSSAFADRAIRFAFEKGIFVGAICAAPSLLGKRGFLKGLRATSYPTFLDDSPEVHKMNKPVVRDGTVITASGAGVSADFALALAEALYGREKAVSLRKSLQMP